MAKMILDAHWLHCGDCLEFMRAQLPDEIVDITITSPPYNLGNAHHTNKKRHSSYDDWLPEDVYQQNQIEVLNEIYRVTSAGGSLLYNHKNRIRKGVQITPYEWLLKTKWVVKQEIVWVNGSPNMDKIRLYPHTERVYWLAKSRTTKLNNVISHTDVFTTSDWKPVGTKGKRTRAFPEQMVEDLLRCFPDSFMVFDPYAGRGTTGVVAKRMGKLFVGCELKPEFYKLCEESING